MKLTFSRIFTVFLLGGFVAWLAAYRPFSANTPADPAFLELIAASPGEGTLVLRIDEGHGYADNRPSEIAVKLHRSAPVPVRLPIPPGRIRGMKLNVFGTPTVAIRSVRLHTASGHVIAAFSHDDIHASSGTLLNVSGTELVLAGAQLGQTSFQFELRTREPLQVASGNEPPLWEFAGTWLAASALFGLLAHFLAPRWPGERLLAVWAKLTPAMLRQPVLTLSVVALAAAIVSSYPVVFFGKSFVAPNTGAHLLYFGFPTLPGAPNEQPEDVKGSDVACIQWCDIPFTAMVGRALFQDGELPLWNRFDACGVPLLGQAQTMIGDPLGLIPLLAGSQYWAWDLKFLLAKALFALGIGLCVYQATRGLGVAALLGASAAWIGFFAYRFNHPAFFSVSYAPWILLPWLALRDGGSRRTVLLAAAGLVLANWAELNSGTAKEAAILILCVNFAGLLAVLLHPGRRRDGLRHAAPLLWANLLFVLLSAPLWLVFLDTLHRSVTVYDVPRAMQLPPGVALGFFDGLFTQDTTSLGNHVHPSLNFLFLAGVLWLFATDAWRRRRLAWALGLAALLPAAMVFGLVPGRWITATPFLGNIIHIHNTFGCVLLILIPPLAGLGLQDAWERAERLSWRRNWLRTLALFALPIGGYLWFRYDVPSNPDALFTDTLSSRFFILCALAMIAGAALFPWVLRGVRRNCGWAWALGVVALFAIHFRHGMYVETKFDPYVMNPRSGYDLEAKSLAIDRTRRRLVEPYRVAGFSGTLSPGYQALLGLESVTGADALENRYYHELCRAAKLAQADWRLIIPEGTAPANKPLYDMLNLRFYLRDPSSRPAPEGFETISRMDLHIVESREAWPRAFFTDRLQAYAGPEELVELVKKGDGKPFAAFEGLAPSIPVGDRVAPARDYRFTTNSTGFTVSAPGPGVAVLGETFETDNFQVTINGAPAAYHRVNHAFKVVELPAAGEYRIVFSYWPAILTPALWLSALGLILALASAALCLRRSAPAPAPAAWDPLPTT